MKKIFILFFIATSAPAFLIAQKTKTTSTKPFNFNTVDLPKNLSDSTLLDSIEHRTFQFFWSGAEPASGMAPERIHMDEDYPDHDPAYYCNRW